MNRKRRRDIIAGDVLVICQNNKNNIVVVVAEIPGKYFITLDCVVMAFCNQGDEKIYRNIEIYNSKKDIINVNSEEVVHILGHVPLNEEHIDNVFKHMDPAVKEIAIHKTYEDIIDDAWNNGDTDSFDDCINYIADKNRTYDIANLREEWINHLVSNKSAAIERFNCSRQKVEYWVRKLKNATKE